MEQRTKVCKGCAGQGSHRSNVSRTVIKCPRCHGTGNVKNEVKITNFIDNVSLVEYFRFY